MSDNHTITRIAAYEARLPVVGGEYRMSHGKVIKEAVSIVVRIETDGGLAGHGEACPLGSNYLPAYAGGVVPGLAELAPNLLGRSAIEIDPLNRRMDALFKGHAYVKSPIDVACWDILGQATGQPVWRLLGGRAQTGVPLYHSLTSDTPEAMVTNAAHYREKGYRHFQIKCDGHVEMDIARIRAVCGARQPGETFIADSNQGWTQHEAMTVIQAVRNIQVYIEQPCATLAECLAVREKSPHAFKLDETIDSVHALLDGWQKNAMDVVCLKVSKVGGLSKARQIRDLCASMGLAMTVEDVWGSDIVTAALGHLAISTAPPVMLNATDLNRYNIGSIAEGAPKVAEGRMMVSDRPGLGINPRWDVLGEPVFDLSI
ncbi:mandelate racemase/muconate lactonizing enzyme family protein [Aestuariispira insulae]|uniref:L-alanine-DL-glutamate epimerase-like enolase superfamily enzyme n=1 Tax=Aestuariispira insulae TaxID=1461337 RepID=A0A3D9HGM5_9PROT|nr:mandelate racemase/muconate lactonizing enzyme family protein [Aestuariispira insulae]RED48565.1 L-alanine-DL-glutamate epimerase-like enolase superfamily enzyme [Aestuariispira insulae]